MGELRKGGSVAWAVGIGLAALLALYVGAYYVMVIPSWGYPHPVSPNYATPMGRKTNHDLIGMSFAPVHWLDRRIRPHVWGP